MISSVSHRQWVNEQNFNTIAWYNLFQTNFLEKMSSKCRQNYHEESEALVNRQINVELNAYYQYLALVSLNTIYQKRSPPDLRKNWHTSITISNYRAHFTIATM